MSGWYLILLVLLSSCNQKDKCEFSNGAKAFYGKTPNHCENK